jgi:uncharacterized membrane protein
MAGPRSEQEIRMRKLAMSISFAALLATASTYAEDQRNRGSQSLVPQEYEFQIIDAPFEDTDQTAFAGINETGAVVGSYHHKRTGWHGLLYERGHFISFDAPGGGDTHFGGINNRGQIVGYVEINRPSPPNPSSQLLRGFVVDRRCLTPSQMKCDPLSWIEVPFAGPRGTIARANNDRGQVVGGYLDEDGGVHGFLFDRGAFKRIDVPFPQAHDTGATGINNRGQIVGTYNSLDPGAYTQGFLYDRGAYIHLATPATSITNGTEVSGINDRSQIVACVESNIYFAEKREFASLDAPFGSCAQGINNFGMIAGYNWINSNILRGLIGIPANIHAKHP